MRGLGVTAMFFFGSVVSQMLTRYLPLGCLEICTRSNRGSLPIFAKTWDLIIAVWSGSACATIAESPCFFSVFSIISSVSKRQPDAGSSALDAVVAAFGTISHVGPSMFKRPERAWFAGLLPAMTFHA